jgi:hypothetical protein
MTGMAAEHPSTITSSLRTAENSAMTGSITVTSITATSAMVDSVAATLTTVVTATRSTEVRVFTRSQEDTREGSVALIMAEMREDFPPAGTPALEVAASMAVDPMVVVRMVVAGGINDLCIGPY